MNGYFCVLLFLVSVVSIDGAMYRNGVEIENVYGHDVKFCKYKKLRLLPKSKIRDYDDCMECECTNEGLSCASIGATFSVPEESRCEVVSIGCRNKWVLKKNRNRRCPKRLMPEEIVAVGK